MSPQVECKLREKRDLLSYLQPYLHCISNYELNRCLWILYLVPYGLLGIYHYLWLPDTSASPQTSLSKRKLQDNGNVLCLCCPEWQPVAICSC